MRTAPGFRSWLVWLIRALGLVAGMAFGMSAIAAEPGFTESDVDVGDGVRIHVVDGGDRAAKTTLLFVPGWATSTRVWRDQMARFAPAARVVSIDPRSQGQSTVTTHANSPEQRAKDLRKVMQALALKNVVLVGWSQGVQDVAAYVAAFHDKDEGGAIAAYVLVDAAVGAGTAAAVAQPGQLKEELDRFSIYQRYPAEYLKGMMNAIIHSAAGRQHIDEYVQVGLRTPTDVGITMLLMDFVVVDRRPSLAKFNRPTLIVAAAGSDELAAQQDMAKTIKDARFTAIANAGHAVFLDQPQAFYDLLAGFVREVQGAGKL